MVIRVDPLRGFSPVKSDPSAASYSMPVMRPVDPARCVRIAKQWRVPARPARHRPRGCRRRVRLHLGLRFNHTFARPRRMLRWCAI